MMMPKSLESLVQQRTQITDQVAALGDLRCGSITSTSGRCGKSNCRCHQPNQPAHGPNLRLTYKVRCKTVTESLPDPAAVRKAEREIGEFRKFQTLHKEFLEVNAQICERRPAEPEFPAPVLENKVEEFATLPASWNQDENATRRIGSRWRRQGSSCLLAVPSAILPEESNFVLNPEHPDAKRLRLVRERPFTFHPRLI